jgi:threonine/homoserine/homoserine lactone efflux protein
LNDYLFILPIAVALLLGVMSPGPSFFLVAQTAMSQSRKNALFISLGMGIGAMIFSFLAVSGLYLLIKTSHLLYTILKIFGGFYLLFLAYKIFSSSKQIATIDTPIYNSSARKNFFIGLFAQLSNPKTAIVIGSIFAAFLPSEIPHYSLILLCSLAFILDASWYSIVSILLSTKKAQNAYLQYKQYINFLSISFIVAIGIKLIFM